MTTYSVAEAKDKLSELIDRALRGEGVIVTRHGTPVVELRPVRAAPRPITQADIDWLRAHRFHPEKPFEEDSGALISRMRDEEWDR